MHARHHHDYSRNHFTQIYKHAHSYTLGITNAHTILQIKTCLTETNTCLAETKTAKKTTKGACPQVHDPLVQEIIEETQKWKHYDERKHKHENQTLDDWQASSLGQHACQASPWLFKKSFHTNLQTRTFIHTRNHKRTHHFANQNMSYGNQNMSYWKPKQENKSNNFKNHNRCKEQMFLFVHESTNTLLRGRT